MKKEILLSIFAVWGICASASTFMRVEKSDGTIDRFDVEEVKEVTHTDSLLGDSSNSGVTISGQIGSFTYVDMGLSVKWATYNVGATKPEQIGNYFAFGETLQHTDTMHLRESYKWYDKTLMHDTKYCADSTKTFADGLRELEPEDDAATVNWGNDWRMPTIEEAQELLDNCFWEWSANFNNTGVSGMVAKSKINLNIIFFPEVGYCKDFIHSINEVVNLYWTKSLVKGSDESAYQLNLAYGSPQTCSGYKFMGCAVRAVSEK